jgi:hypothetical protein
MTVLRIFGFVVTAAIVLGVAGFGLVFANERALSLTSDDAELVADTYNVGTAYAGSVQDISIQRGSVVTAGQDLLRLQSATLQQALQTSRFSEAGVGYRVENDDVIVFTAVKDGVVQELNANIGSFVPANQVIAVVGIAETLHLESTFTMNARDYARLPVGGSVSVDMPDGRAVSATIYDIQVNKNDGGEAETVVRARSEEITLSGSLLAGAPVTAQLELVDEEGLGTWVARQVGKLFVPNGFSA